MPHLKRQRWKYFITAFQNKSDVNVTKEQMIDVSDIFGTILNADELRYLEQFGPFRAMVSCCDKNECNCVYHGDDIC